MVREYLRSVVVGGSKVFDLEMGGFFPDAPSLSAISLCAAWVVLALPTRFTPNADTFATLAQAQKVFKEFDKDGSGTIDVSEVRKAP